MKFVIHNYTVDNSKCPPGHIFNSSLLLERHAWTSVLYLKQLDKISRQCIPTTAKETDPHASKMPYRGPQSGTLQQAVSDSGS